MSGNGNTVKNWSAFQKAIFAFLATLTGNLVIMARAGCGKSTTIVEGIKHLPKGLKVLFCAFNKKIAEELAIKLGNAAEAKTLHSIGFALIRGAFRSVRVDNDKGYRIASNIVTDAGSKYPDLLTDKGDPKSEVVSKVMRLAGLIKGSMLQSADDLTTLAITLGIFDNGEDVDLFCKMAFFATEDALADKTCIDFDDMLFFPWALSLGKALYDVVIVDEAQDMNPAQLWLARNVVKANGRVIIVGDDRQAIYGWNGADSDAMRRMTVELNATVLPLSETYRCPEAVVSLINPIVPDLTTKKPGGTVRNISRSEMFANVKVGDCIISRKNAPMMSVCLKLLAKGIPAAIQGRDVAASLMKIVDKSKAKDIPALVEYLNVYRDREETRASKMPPARRESRMATVDDTIECVMVLTEGCASIADLKSNLDRLFTDDNPKSKVRLSSVHRAKGLEWDNVFTLSETFQPGRNTEEANLWYVAVTRTLDTLNIVAPDKA